MWKNKEDTLSIHKISYVLPNISRNIPTYSIFETKKDYSLKANVLHGL